MIFAKLCDKNIFLSHLRGRTRGKFFRNQGAGGVGKRCAGNPVILWQKSRESCGAPITEITVTDSDFGTLQEPDSVSLVRPYGKFSDTILMPINKIEVLKV